MGVFIEEMEREATEIINKNIFNDGTEKIIEWLEKNPECYDIQIRRYRATPFLIACYHNNEQLINFLEEKKVNIHYQDLYGRNAVCIAISNNHVGLIKKLYKKGISVDMPDCHKDTPLIRAARYNFNECLKELIECNANVNQKNKYGHDFLHYVETKYCEIETTYLMENLHLFNKKNKKRIKKIRLMRLFEGGI